MRAGHVGVIGVISDKIVGFHPTPAATEAAGGEKALLDALKRNQPQPGRLQDDNAYFERAHELISATDGRTAVYTYEVEISEATLARIRSWYTEGRETLYNFPHENGQFNTGESNCAMYWVEHFRIPLPKRTGSIKVLTKQMRDEGYDTWQPNA